MSSPSPDEHHLWKPAVNPWIIAITVMIATFMEVLDTSVANVSLPHIAGSLSAGVDESTWVLTSYLVSNAIVLPLAGWLSMIFGRKRLYMTCVGLFTISSMMCGLAPSLTMLVVFRVLQGIGGGALQPISQAILFESFPRQKHGMAMAFYGIGVVFAPIIGPTLGGWITDNFSWRWIFLINVPVGVLSIALSSIIVQDPPYLVRKKLGSMRIDYIGLGLLTLGLGCLEAMLDKGERADWFGSSVIVTLGIIAGIALVSVIFWEILEPEPVVDLRLLKDRNFGLALLTMFMLGGVLYGSTVLLPLFLQMLLGYTAMQSGLVISPGGFAVVLLMPVVGWLLSRFQPRTLIMIGLLLCSAGLYDMSGFTLELDFSRAVWARVIQAAGLAFLFVPLNTAAFSHLPRPRINAGTGLVNLARNAGGSTGIALITTFLAQRGQYHQAVLVSHLTPYDPAYRMALDNSAHALAIHGSGTWLAGQQAYGAIYGALSRQAMMLAFNDCFWVMMVAFVCLLPLVRCMSKLSHAAPSAPAD